MAKKAGEIKERRPFWEALIWEKSGDMNLSYVFCIVLLVTAVLAVIGELVTGGHLSNAGWGFLITSFMAVLLASVPIARAKIIANSKLMDAASAVSQATTSAANPQAGLLNEISSLLQSDPTGKKAIAQAISELSGSL